MAKTFVNKATVSEAVTGGNRQLNNKEFRDFMYELEQEVTKKVNNYKIKHNNK